MRPKRLSAFDYCGCYRYFVTSCTWHRELYFSDPDLVAMIAAGLTSSFAERGFSCLAWTFMPDHVHLLLEGTSDGSNFRAAMKLARQRTGLVFQQSRRRRLWQDGYYERVLRRDEDTRAVIRYILNNPVRAGLAAAWNEYKFSWALDTEGR